MRLIEHTPKRWAQFVRARSPIIESIVPLDKRGRRSWAVMRDGELVAHAKWFLEDNGIASKKRLQIAHLALYTVLLKRKLLDKLELKACHKSWQKYPDIELVDYAQKFVDENGIRVKTQLDKTERGLSNALKKRGLLGSIRFRGDEGHRRNWAAMSDDEIVAHAKEYMDREGVTSRAGLMRSDSGLYKALFKRGLLDSFAFEKKLRDWAAMSDEELVEFAKKLISEKGLDGKSDLCAADSGLYRTLGGRDLLDDLGFVQKQRNWKSLSDEEIVEVAKKFIEENGVKKRKELERLDIGLYCVLQRRKLHDSVGFEDKRSWSAMSDEELVGYAKQSIKKKGIVGRAELKYVFSILYWALQKRKLLDHAFSDTDGESTIKGIQEISDAMSEFGGEECD